VSAPEGSVPEDKNAPDDESALEDARAVEDASVLERAARAPARLVLVALTMATASLDVTAFLRLGGVFASVMTSNLIFVSVAVVKTEAAFGRRCAVAILSYIVGVAVGSAIAPPSGNENRLGARPLSLLLTAELAVVAGYAAWWMAVDGRPAGWAQLVLLGLLALAMGGQSAAARQLGNPNAGTTYMTGTLTSLVGSVAGRHRPDPESVAVLIALLAGAAAGVGLIDVAPVTVPLLALAGVGTAAVLSWTHDARAADDEG
jgi:uncharacterized membrane protein YoaK (UPF0700 family)